VCRIVDARRLQRTHQAHDNIGRKISGALTSEGFNDA
jgi:hypothetical protein